MMSGRVEFLFFTSNCGKELKELSYWCKLLC